MRDATAAPIDISLPKPDGNNGYAIKFKIENLSRPIDHSLGDDTRSLGVWVSNMTLVQ
jgi:hypothetical protein